MRSIVLAAAFACAAAVGTAFGARAETLTFQPAGETLERPLQGELFRPEGSGLFPAVVILHGCAGTNPLLNRRAAFYARWGMVAFVPDSFGPRGITETCINSYPLPPEKRALDALGAAQALTALPYVAKGKIALLGFSQGGRIALDVLTHHAGAIEGLIAGAAVFYPTCLSDHGKIRKPTLVLVGDADDWAPAEFCKDVKAGVDRSIPFELVVYSGATHAFDVPGPEKRAPGWNPRTRQRETFILRHDPQATKDANGRIWAFLEKWTRN